VTGRVDIRSSYSEPGIVGTWYDAYIEEHPWVSGWNLSRLRRL